MTETSTVEARPPRRCLDAAAPARRAGKDGVIALVRRGRALSSARSPAPISDHPDVPYDEELAARIRDLLAAAPDVTEKMMFGGIAFLVGGNMAVAASSQGGILVRVNPAHNDALTSGTGASVAVMRGRPMPGWLRVEGGDLGSPGVLAQWVERGTTYARSLPAKR